LWDTSRQPGPRPRGDGQHYFGLLEVANGHVETDYGLVVGLRLGRLRQHNKKERHQLMDSNLDHQVNVVVGLFVVACLASAFFYGPFSIVVGVVGLFVIAAILRVFRGGE
jgi:hypothetical protein